MTMNTVPRCALVGCMALQVGIAMAVSSDRHVVSTVVESRPSAFRFRSPSTSSWAPTAMSQNPRRGSGGLVSSSAFATGRSHQYRSRQSTVKRVPIVQDRNERTAPQFNSMSMRSSPLSRGPLPSTSLFLLPPHLEHLSIIAPLAFLPMFDYLYDLATFMLGLSFTFAAGSFLVTKPLESLLEDHDVVDQPLLAYAAAAGGGGDVNGSVKFQNTELLTPADYATSRSAELQVENDIVTKAEAAFNMTDFAHEPHLSPELEDAEAAYEVALLASAAHELVEAADKENRQSKAAMLERERELEWIQKGHGKGLRSRRREAFLQLAIEAKEGGSTKREEFQRSLLSARFANEARAKDQIGVVEQQLKEEFLGSEVRAASMGGPESVPFEMASAAALTSAALALEEATAEEGKEPLVQDFQRSLLAARIANDAKANNGIVERQLKEEFLGSEIRAASMGRPEGVLFEMAGAAASAAAAVALEEAEAEEGNEQPVEDNEGGDAAAPAAAASAVVADTAERMILGEDLAFFEHAPAEDSPSAPQEEEAAPEPEVRLLVNDAILNEADRWRKDACDVRKYVQRKAIKETKEKMSRRDVAERNSIGVAAHGGDAGSGDERVATSMEVAADSTALPDDSKDLAVSDEGQGSGESVVKRTLQRGFMQRIRRRKSLVVVALAVVLGRRLCLAYFGNALRLI